MNEVSSSWACKRILWNLSWVIDKMHHYSWKSLQLCDKTRKNNTLFYTFESARCFISCTCIIQMWLELGYFLVSGQEPVSLCCIFLNAWGQSFSGPNSLFLNKFYRSMVNLVIVKLVLSFQFPGYMIISYLVREQSLSVEAAFQLFKASRQPGQFRSCIALYLSQVFWMLGFIQSD